jgi:hypothetical protein
MSQKAKRLRFEGGLTDRAAEEWMKRRRKGPHSGKPKENSTGPGAEEE